MIITSLRAGELNDLSHSEPCPKCVMERAEALGHLAASELGPDNEQVRFLYIVFMHGQGGSALIAACKIANC
jgi:hypothetical protein